MKKYVLLLSFLASCQTTEDLEKRKTYSVSAGYCPKNETVTNLEVSVHTSDGTQVDRVTVIWRCYDGIGFGIENKDVYKIEDGVIFIGE